jgi:hypothetical protein
LELPVWAKRLVRQRGCPEVQNKPHVEIGGPQVVDALRCLSPAQPLQGLDFDDEPLVSDQVPSASRFEPSPLVGDGQLNHKGVGDVSSANLDDKSVTVDAHQPPAAELPVGGMAAPMIA